MMNVYTLDEVARLLDRPTDTIRAMAKSGQLSGFWLNPDWRFSEAALRADFKRMRRVHEGFDTRTLTPLTSEQTELEMAPRPKPTPIPKPRKPDAFESFDVNIHLQNKSPFSGEFRVNLTAEGNQNSWEAFEGGQCNIYKSELTVRNHLEAGQTRPFFNGSLQARLGDRLFISVPGQAGLTEATEEVLVLSAHTDLQLTLTHTGVLTKKRVLRFKRL